MSENIRKELTIETLVGLFMFIVLIALGVFTIVLSRQNFLQKKYPLEVVFSEVGGLREGDHVFLRGTKVGVVKATLLENNHVVVRSDLDVPVQFRAGYKVEVVASSMLGGKLLKIYEGPVDAVALPPETTILGEEPVEILEELGLAIEELQQLTHKVTAGEGTLGRLLSDETMYQSMKAMVENLTAVSETLARGEGTIGKLIQDETLYRQIQSTASNLDELSTRLVHGQGTLGKLMAPDDTLYTDAQGALQNIRQITEMVKSGEGTLGKLVEDDEIYVEAKKLLEELRAAVDDMRETSPVTTFSSVLFGAF